MPRIEPTREPAEVERLTRHPDWLKAAEALSAHFYGTKWEWERALGAFDSWCRSVERRWRS